MQHFQDPTKLSFPGVNLLSVFSERCRSILIFDVDYVFFTNQIEHLRLAAVVRIIFNGKIVSSDLFKNWISLFHVKKL